MCRSRLATRPVELHSVPPPLLRPGRRLESRFLLLTVFPDVDGLDAIDYSALVAHVAIARCPGPRLVVDLINQSLSSLSPIRSGLPRSSDALYHTPLDLGSRDTIQCLQTAPLFPPSILRTQIKHPAPSSSCCPGVLARATSDAIRVGRMLTDAGPVPCYRPQNPSSPGQAVSAL